MSTAIAGGLVVLVCAACLVADLAIEHIRRIRDRVDDEHAAEHSHRALMRELRRHAEDDR